MQMFLRDVQQAQVKKNWISEHNKQNLMMCPREKLKNFQFLFINQKHLNVLNLSSFLQQNPKSGCKIWRGNLPLPTA